MIKNRFKKIFVRLFILGIIIIPQVSLAQLGGLNATAGATGHKSITTKMGGNLYGIVGNIINTVLGILGIIFLILMIYGGMIWMTAQGNDQKVEEAQKIIKNAVFGIVIVAAAYLVTYFVISRLTGETLQ